MYVCTICESCISIHTSCEYPAMWFVPMVQKLLLHGTMVVVLCGGVIWNTINQVLTPFKHKDCQLRKLCGGDAKRSYSR